MHSFAFNGFMVLSMLGSSACCYFGGLSQGWFWANGMATGLWVNDLLRENVIPWAVRKVVGK